MDKLENCINLDSCITQKKCLKNTKYRGVNKRGVLFFSQYSKSATLKKVCNFSYKT